MRFYFDNFKILTTFNLKDIDCCKQLDSDHIATITTEIITETTPNMIRESRTTKTASTTSTITTTMTTTESEIHTTTNQPV
jgi:hypothetical protein